MRTEVDHTVPASVKEEWTKRELGDFVDPEKLFLAIKLRQKRLTRQQGYEVSTISSLCSLLDQAGVDVNGRREFVGQTYGVLFPTSLL